MKRLVLEEVDSTNSYAAANAAALDDMTFITARRQTAGRGQRGNSWESEPGRNITVTLFHRPAGFPAAAQFALSEAVALALRDLLAVYGIDSRVKWPNDIYVGDRKISGTLIENSLLSGLIEHARIGIGFNVNQTEFRSGAPNPVSMAGVLGRELDVEEVLARMSESLGERLRQVASETGRHEIHAEFKRRLWRGDGRVYPFRRRDDGRLFNASIADVAPTGMLTLRDADTGEFSTFAFKEVEFVLNQDNG